MKLSRAIAALAFGTLVLPSMGAAAEYPERPIRLIVPYAPGGTADTFARLVAPGLESRLKQPVVIDNVQGAGGSTGIARAVKATPDG